MALGIMANPPVYSRATLRPITVLRAIHWAAIAVTGWSLSLRWGDELAAGKGPPSQWERHVVGAVLLLFVAAMAMALTARKEKKPGPAALVVAGGASVASFAIALLVRSDALGRGLGHVLTGSGWLWMAAGSCMAVGASLSAVVLRFQKEPETATVASKGAPPGGYQRKAKKKKKKR